MHSWQHTTRQITGITLIIFLILTVVVFYFYYYNRVIYKAWTNRKIVALTFDDGPDSRYDPDILDNLDKYQAKATFFMVGQQAEKNSSLVKEIANKGHEIGDHTYSHSDLRKLNNKKIEWEIVTGRKIIENITGQKIVWFRPPKKLYGANTSLIVHKQGMGMAIWKIALENQQFKTPEAMAARVVSHIQPGWIILIHDGRLDRTKSVQALPIILRELKSKGYSFVTMSELMHSKGGY